MKAVAIIRCSSKPQLDKYGPELQLQTIQEGCQQFPRGTLEIVHTFQLQERATGWNRKKWDGTMDECLEAYRRGEIQVVIFPKVDRETRFLAGSFEKLVNLIKAGALVYFAETALCLDKEHPDAWESYQKEALDAQSYIRVMRKNTMGGRTKAAKAGKIPSGFGRYGGYLGLRYEKTRKMLVHVPEQIDVASEILNRYINEPGSSSSKLTRELQSRNINGAGGNVIHRSSVSRVLAKARAYAGIIDWNGMEIRGKIENPIITEEQAGLVAERLKRNKEKSLGFGKRKWLTGRVFCQVCGRRYNLDSKKGCYCNGADNRNPTKCLSPKVGLIELSGLVYGTMILALSEPATVIQRAKESHDNWEKQKQLRDELNRGKQNQEMGREKRRKLLSFQHENGGLTNDEYLKKLGEIQKEKDISVGVEEFLDPEPPTQEQVQKTYCRLEVYLPLRLHFRDVLRNSNDKEADELAEKSGLKVVVGLPKTEGQKYSVQVLLDLPITESEMLFPNEDNPYAMVFSSSPHYDHRQPQSPAHVSHVPVL